MSNNDKAKQKLMESMRMTKADSSKKTEEVDTKKNIASQDDKSIKKKKNAALKKAAKDTQELTVDSYRSVRRVWPD